MAMLSETNCKDLISMTTLELCAKLESLSAGDVATLFFKDGEIIRGGMLYNPVQQRGVIIDPGTETQRRFEASEVAKVWRR
jgi:hypothetical protein